MPDIQLPAFLRATLAAASLCVVAGCGAPATVEDAPIEVPAEFSDSGEVALEAHWWTTFEDPGLDAAVEAALAGNLDLLAAAARVDAARALVDRRAADRSPQIGATARGGFDAPSDDQSPWSATVGLQASYEVDLWGRIAAQTSAEALRAEASQADYEAAAVTLTAEIALAWVRLGALEEELAVYDQQLATNETMLDMVERRFALGAVPAADVLRQRELVEATLQERELVQADIGIARNALAVLMGRGPHEDVPQPTALLRAPALPATGVPADLLARRPDVRSAFLRLQAADRDVAAALAARYPQLDLAASLSTGGRAAEGIFRDWALSLAADVFAPLFQGGRIRADIERAEALERAQLYEYGQTMLVALREVEDALARERREEERLERLRERVNLAARSAERLEAAYLNGVASYLDVLAATTDVQRLERSVIAARASSVEHRIALYRALAGAFETEPPDAGVDP